MKLRSYLRVIILFASILLSAKSFSQRYEIRIVNMIPRERSSDTAHDGEPNIAVNPANPQIIAASAFTFSSNRQWCDTFPCYRIPDSSFPRCKAPIYLSMDGGNNWELQELVPSNNGITHDITVAFSDTGYLYVTALKGCQYSPARGPNNFMKGFFILRSKAVVRLSEQIESLIRIDQRFGFVHDQPWIEAVTSIDTISGRPVFSDRVFVGVNKQQDALSSPARDTMYEGRTARVLISGNAEITPTLFNAVVIESITNNDKNPGAVRVAIHRSGKVYAIFLRSIPGVPRPTIASERCRVVVVRDDSFGQGLVKFDALGLNGQVVADNQTTTYHRLGDEGWLGRCRVGGSNLAIAADPNNDQHVFVGWCSLNAEGIYTLNFRQSWDGGLTWTNDHLPSIPNAMNPAIAMTSDGRVGLLYQQLVADLSGIRWWETHFTMKHWNLTGVLVPEGERGGEYVLSRFRDDELPERNSEAGRPPVGDYLDLVAVSNVFYGVFSAINTPNNILPGERRDRRFPIITPQYNRQQGNAGQLTDLDGNLIRSSVDPFFFKVERKRS